MLTPKLRIELFGGLRLTAGGEVPTEISGQQTGALLAHLALNLHRNCARDEILARIWPEEKEEDSRPRLRQSTYSLRKLLEEPPFNCSGCLIANRTSLRLNDELITTDVDAFESALGEAAKSTDAATRLSHLARAVELYRGPLLPGFYQDYFVSEQNRLSELYLSALHALILAYEQAGELDSAIDHARRAIALDPLMEETHCCLMRLYAAKGQPSAVLRQYQDLEKVLREELNEKPSSSARELMESLRTSGFKLIPTNISPAGDRTGPVVPAAGDQSVRPDDYNVAAGRHKDDPQQKTRRRRALWAWLLGAVVIVAIVAIAKEHWMLNPAPRAVWIREYSGSTDEQNSEPTDMWVDVAGNTFITGFERVAGHDVDFLTAKYDKTGKLVWKQTYDGPGKDVDRARSIALVGRGDWLYVCGESDNGKGNGGTRFCGLDFAVVSYDTDGRQRWVSRYNGDADGEDWAVKVCADGSANCWVAGYSAGGPDKKHPTFSTVILKYDHDGGKLLSKSLFDYGVPLDTRPTDMTLMTGGDILVTGYGAIPGPGPTRTASFLASYSLSGKLRWKRWFQESDEGDLFPRKLCVTGAGEIYVASRIHRPHAAGRPVDADIAVTQFDLEGNTIWQRSWGGESQMMDSPHAIAVDASGVYVTGETMVSADNYDIVTLSYDRNGNERWIRQYAGKGGHNDGGHAIAFDRDGSVYVGGFAVENPTPGDPKFGKDYIVLKYSSTGELKWKETLDSRVHNTDEITALRFDNTANSLIVTGQMATETAPAITTIKYRAN